MLPNLESALKNLEREVIDMPMGRELLKRILKEFESFRGLFGKIPANQSNS